MADKLQTVALPGYQFDNVARWVLRSDADRLAGIKIALDRAVARLGVAGGLNGPRKLRRLALTQVPAGSDQFDLGSVVSWLDKITPADTAAVLQVLKLLATVLSRLGG